MTDSHILPHAEVTECCEERHPRERSVLKNVEAKPDFANCHSSICCQSEELNAARLWVPGKYLLPLLCHNPVCKCRNTRRHQGCGDERVVPARALWCASHAKHPAAETWVLWVLCWVEEMLGGLDTSFLSQCSPRPIFFLHLQYFAHLLMPISKASPHQPERTQSSRREPTDHVMQSQNPMSNLRCLRMTDTANPNGKIPNSQLFLGGKTYPIKQGTEPLLQMLLRAGSCPESFVFPCLWDVGRQ